MFKKILVPVDGSICSQKALKTAASLAKNFSSQILIVHVVEIRPIGTLLGDWAGWSGQFLNETMDALRENATRILKKSTKLVAKEIPSAKTKLIVDSPVFAICETAKKEKCDLIAMGSRGLSDFKGLFLGSVSHGVLQRSHGPVLLVKK